MKFSVAVLFLLLGSLAVIISGCALRTESEPTHIVKSSLSGTPLPTPIGLPSSTPVAPSTSEVGASILPPPTPKSLAPSDITEPASMLYFLDQRKGWVLLEDALYHTKDGGEAWIKLNHRPLRNYKKIIFVTELKGYALQDDWDTQKRSNSILSTEDGGRSWCKVLELPTPIYSIDFTNNRTGYVSSRWYPIQHTTDGGKTWKELDGIEGLNYLYFTSEKEGWGFGGAVWRTEDSGKTWTQKVPYELIADLWDAKFINQSSGWIIGGRQQLWFTNDGGTWQQVANLPAPEKRLSALDFVSNNEGWIASEDGIIIRTQDGGITWQVVANLGNNLSTINFTSWLKGWAVGKQGKLFRTNDGGSNWVVVSLRAG
jgi:photosystem II stability/assembly factor-like uncharacterized protein